MQKLRKRKLNLPWHREHPAIRAVPQPVIKRPPRSGQLKTPGIGFGPFGGLHVSPHLALGALPTKESGQARTAIQGSPRAMETFERLATGAVPELARRLVLANLKQEIDRIAAQGGTIPEIHQARMKLVDALYDDTPQAEARRTRIIRRRIEDERQATAQVIDLRERAETNYQTRAQARYQRTMLDLDRLQDRLKIRLGEGSPRYQEAAAHIETLRQRAAALAGDDPLKGFRIGLLEAERRVTTLAEAGRRVAETASQAMGQSFEQFFFDIMEGRVKRLDVYFKSFFSSVARAMMSLAAQRTASFIMSSLGSLFAGSGGTKEMARGGVLPGRFVPLRKFQTGGIVRRPTFGLIGEGSRHEAVVPLPDNRSIPVIFPQGSQTQTAIAPNVQVQINVTNQGPALDMKVVNRQVTQNAQGQAKLILDVVTYGVMTNPGLRAALKSV
ncbi:MAG: hypothetical protein KJ621_06055 [Proteobacteria bacterium]|nr:hypothetical protein [Pseudomonadota bacterium]